MKKLTRTTIFLFMIFVSAAIVFATGGKEDTPPEEVPVYTFQFTGWGSPTEPADFKYYEEWQEALNEKLAKDLGFKVNFIDRKSKGNYQEVITLAAVDGQGLDYFYECYYLVPDPAWNKLFLPLNDLIDEYCQDVKRVLGDSGAVWNQIMLGDTIYGLPIPWPYDTSSISVRGDLLEEAGISWPSDPMKISLDWYENAFETFMRENPGKSGIHSTGGHYHFIYGHYFSNLVHAAEGNIYWVYDEKTNQMSLIEDDPKYKEALWRFKTWFDKGYIAPDTFVKNRVERREDFVKGNVLMHHAHPESYWTTTELDAFMKLNPEIAEKLRPLSLGIDVYPTNGRTELALFVTKMCENPEELIQFFNWLHIEENYMLANYGIEGTTYVTQDTPFGKAIGIPESERSDLVVVPMDLIGYVFDFNFDILEYEKKFLPANITRPQYEGRQILYSLNANNTFMNPIQGLDVSISTEDWSSWVDSTTYYNRETQKLWLELNLPKDEFFRRYEEIVNEYKRIGAEATLNLYNKAMQE